MNNQGDCDKLTQKLGGAGTQVQGYSFQGFEYCDAQPIYTGDDSKTGKTGCYPILLDNKGVNLAKSLNNNIKMDLKPSCDSPCVPDSSGKGNGCRAINPKDKDACDKTVAVCDSPNGDQYNSNGKDCFYNTDTSNSGNKNQVVSPPIHLCTPWNDGGSCDTALGIIPLNPAAFVEKIIKLILGISGGVIVIMAIVAGYNVMTSAGDPQKLANSKEMIISVITGAFMIVFSMILLNAIGIDILGLPPLIQYRGYGGDGG